MSSITIRQGDALEAEQCSPPAPPFDPDPELIDHAEGNRRSLRGYRRKAEDMRAAALTDQQDSA